MKLYAGIGSRLTPQKVLTEMTMIASLLEQKGYVLRSGGAGGADTAFEVGVNNRTKRQIFRLDDSTPEAEKIASGIHPAWLACSKDVRKLHGRNVQIVLGKNLDQPVEFVVFWSSDITRGGTRMGVVLAQQRNIPTYNLFEEAQQSEFKKLLKGITRWKKEVSTAAQDPHPARNLVDAPATKNSPEKTADTNGTARE